ncbi:MAG: ribonuclease Y [Patescibacteria group bacterium]|nr:ribonuclease Y [Patescibacteria group bacterium]
MEIITILIAIITAIAGGGVGYYVHSQSAKKAGADAKQLLERAAREAETDKKTMIADARDEAHRITAEAKKDEVERRRLLDKLEEHLVEKDKKLEQKVAETDKSKEEFDRKKKEVENLRGQLNEIVEEEKEKLSKIAKMSKDEAREHLLQKVEEEARADMIGRIKMVEEEVKEEADKKARDLIAGAIQRYASEVTTESTITAVELPSNEIKGRIIGREGRNITAFENATGVDVIVDDTPNTIIISGFDLIRRYIAKVALTQLIQDGRIQPAKIEETVEKAQKQINQMIKEFGDKAVLEVGLTGLAPELIKLLGRLRFRTSYGQNVLRHSIETSFIAANIAAELGADEQIAKKAGLLHDIGKAVDHEVEGSHIAIGRDIGRKFGLSEEVIHCIEAHHGDVEFKSQEAIIVQVADAISSSRPGARRESIESYIKRLKDLETAAMSFEGVSKAYAIQAGREIRVIVNPTEIDDLKMIKLSHQIAKEIEQTMEYPGEIKVNVVRETREVEYAR